MTALLVSSALQAHTLARRAAEAELTRTAEVIAQAEAQSVTSARTLLTVLAQSPDIRSALGGSSTDCHTRLAEALELHPDYQGLALADSQGNVICLATNAVPTGSIADRRSFQTAISTGNFAVGDYQVTRPWNHTGAEPGLPNPGQRRPRRRGWWPRR